MLLSGIKLSISNPNDQATGMPTKKRKLEDPATSLMPVAFPTVEGPIPNITRQLQNITTLPKVMRDYVISFLDFRHQTIVSVISKQWRTYQPFANMPINNLLHRLSHRFDLCAKTRTQMSKWIKDPTMNLIQRIQILSRVRLLGYPSASAADTNKQILHSVTGLASFTQDPAEKLKAQLLMWTFAAWGYQPRDHMVIARDAALRAVQNTTHLQSPRQIAQLLADILEYQTTFDPVIQQAGLAKLDHHATTTEKTEWYYDENYIAFTPLIHLAELTVIRNNLLLNLPGTISRLLKLCDNTRATWHMRALATLTLAHDWSLAADAGYPPAEVANRLRILIQQETLDSLQIASARLLLLEFHRRHQIDIPEFNNNETARGIAQAVIDAPGNGALLLKLKKSAKKIILKISVTRELFAD